MTKRSVEAEIGLCLLLSAVDGEISDKELAALTTRIGELLGENFDPMRLPALVNGELESIGALGVDDYVARLPGRIAAPYRFEALRAAAKCACADGLAPEEEEVLRQVAVALEVDAADVIAVVGGKNDTIPAGPFVPPDDDSDAVN